MIKNGKYAALIFWPVRPFFFMFTISRHFLLFI